MSKRHFLAASLALTFTLGLPFAATAQTPAVKVDGAWARASVPGQKASGAFMTLTAPKALRLVGVATPAAGVAEVHEMKMEGEVMRMRAVEGLDLPAGKAVELKPGGYHLMLQDLKAPLTAGSTVPLTLTFADAAGQKSQLQLAVPVQVNAPTATMKSAPAGAMKMDGGMPMDHKH